jgi:hypothetical protein
VSKKKSGKAVQPDYHYKDQTVCCGASDQGLQREPQGDIDPGDIVVSQRNTNGMEQERCVKWVLSGLETALDPPECPLV